MALPPPVTPSGRSAGATPPARFGAAQSGPTAGARKHRRLIIVVAAVVAALVVVVVVADFALRAYAEGQVRQAVIENLPSNVTGDVDVSIGGGPFLTQYLSGTFNEVTLTSKNLQINGALVQARVTAHDVSTDQTKPVPRASASLTIDQSTVNSFLSIPGSDEITFGDGTVGYSGQFQVFGLTLGYDATATAAPQGPDILLTPTGAQLTAGSASFDVGGALKAVVSKPISICVAKYLPVGVQLTSITPTPGSVTVTAEATNLTLTEQALSTTGSC